MGSLVVSFDFKAGSFGNRLLRNCSLEICRQALWVRLDLVLKPRIDVTQEQGRIWGVLRSQSYAEPKAVQEYSQQVGQRP